MQYAVEQQSLLIRGATLIDGTSAPPLRHTTIEVAGERILGVRPTTDADDEGVDRGVVVDATGLTVVPGLFDVHAHVGNLPLNRFDADDPGALMEEFLAWFARWGVTTVRDTGSATLGSAFRELKAGRPAWPRFVGSGPNLDGSPGGPWKGLIVVESPEEAAREAERLLDEGADFLKLYVHMPRDEVRAVAAAAHRRGALVAAHVGYRITVAEAIEDGVDALEHVRIGPELLSAADRAAILALPPRASDYLISFRPWRLIDPLGDAARILADRLAELGTYLTPTLALSRAILEGRSDEIRNGPGVADMPVEVQRAWQRLDHTAEYSDEDWAAAPRELEGQLAFIGLAHRAGVRIVAGTDTPNPWLVPGISLHDELDLLVASGLSPVEAIAAATGRAAMLAGRDDDLGTVQAGKLADLLLVEGDPATDVRALRRIRAVLRGGQVVAGALPDAAGASPRA